LRSKVFLSRHKTKLNTFLQDAAVAVAAGLNVTEPGSTGIGGDMFCLFYNAKTKKVHALNGSGRAGANVTCDKVRKALKIPEGQVGKIPLMSAHAVTVPGAAAGWVDVVEKFGSGKLSMEQILTPAIEMAEQGFPVSELMGYYVRLTTRWWMKGCANHDCSGRTQRRCFDVLRRTMPRC